MKKKKTLSLEKTLPHPKTIDKYYHKTHFIREIEQNVVDSFFFF